MSTTRTIINPDIQWHQPTATGWQIVDYNDIVGGIVQWKNILFEEANFVPGQKFGVGGSQCDYAYVTAIFAGLELGGKIITMPHNHFDKKLIGPLAVWLYEDNVEKAINDGHEVGANTYVPWSRFYNFTSKFNTFDHLDQFAPTIDDTVLVATTSGTSGNTKIVEYSHRLFDDVRKRSIRIFNFDPNDRILHLSNMHHGGTGGVFFLPSLSACKYHYYMNGLNNNEIDNIIKLIKEQKISKAMFPNNLLVDRFLNKVGWLDHDFDIYINQANSSSWTKLLAQTNVRSINSLFGSTETLGPIFLNTITRDSIVNHNVLNYGKLLDDHFSVNCYPDRTEVTIKNHYKEILNDCFVLDQNGDYNFHSKTNLIRINEHVVPMATFLKLSQDLFGNNGVVIPDTVANKIYVAYNKLLNNPVEQISKLEHELQAMSSVLRVDYTDCVDLDLFIVGIKLSMENLREHFRRGHNLL